MKIFLDDTAWCNLVLRELEAHQAVQEVFEDLLKQGSRLVTHNIALGMAMSEIRRVEGTGSANRFIETVEEAYAGTHLSVYWIGRRTQREAQRLFKKYPDLDLSLYDFASYTVISRRRIHTILTTKKDFEKLRLKVLPDLKPAD